MPELTIREKAAAAVRCQSAVLESGLTVLCRTMPGYSTVHAMYATPFGSTVRDFVLDGRPVHLPAGTAHFLEHKMFESEQGDAFSLYAKPVRRPTPLPAGTTPATCFRPPAASTRTWTSC